MINKKYTFPIKIGLVVYAVLGLSVLAISLSGQEAPAKSEKPGGDFIRGATLWANTCARCHNMRDPQELNDVEWRATLTHMRLRAGLTGQDARDILSFLQQSNNQ